MARKGYLLATALVVAVLFGVGYWWYDSVTGNHIEIQRVIDIGDSQENEAVNGAANGTAENGAAGNGTAANGTEDADLHAGSSTPVAVAGEKQLTNESRIYFSITTSRETVNYELADVTGTWDLDDNASASTASGTVGLDSMNSGNSQRDNHVKSAEYMNVSEFPQATFSTSEFSGIPAEWQAGVPYELVIDGQLTVKGIAKDVQFTGVALYEDGQIKMEAETIVTFGDFGMSNPHNVVMETENNIAIQLQLVWE